MLYHLEKDKAMLLSVHVYSFFYGMLNFLTQLNDEYRVLHTSYENLFWLSYMGDHSRDDEMNQAQQAADAFRSSVVYAQQIDTYLRDGVDLDDELKERLE